MYKPEFFAPYELVPKTVYNKYPNKDDIYGLIDERLLRIIDMVRKWAGVPLTVNNWEMGGNRNESGLRDPNTSTGAPKSAHKEGKAVDIISNIKTAQELWMIIEQHKDELPCNIRIEKTSSGKPITWLHIDVNASPSQIEKIYYFNA